VNCQGESNERKPASDIDLITISTFRFLPSLSRHRCGIEYMDIYAEVQSPDPAELINSPFGGRYCGPIPPRRRISLYRAIALSFYTGKNESTPDLFEGRYSFINECEFVS
jgi:hypothetical protein